MRTIAKPIQRTTSGGRLPLTDVLDHLRRVLGAKVERRSIRPLQHLDSWSDQAEVAFYEDGLANRGV